MAQNKKETADDGTPLGRLVTDRGYPEFYVERTQELDNQVLRALHSKMKEVATLAGIEPKKRVSAVLENVHEETVSSFVLAEPSKARPRFRKVVARYADYRTGGRASFEASVWWNKTFEDGPQLFEYAPDLSLGSEFHAQWLTGYVRIFNGDRQGTIGENYRDPVQLVQRVLDRIRGNQVNPREILYGPAADDRSIVEQYLTWDEDRKGLRVAYDEQGGLAVLLTGEHASSRKLGRSIEMGQVYELSELKSDIEKELDPEDSRKLLEKVAEKRFGGRQKVTS